MTLLAACGEQVDSTSESVASSAVSFPYPPFEIKTDVAVSLEPLLLGAAEFALEMSVDNRLKNIPGNDEIEQRFRSRIAPEDDIGDSPPAPANFVGATGGALHRAVSARELPDDTVEVSICAYDTPGLYAKSKDGKLIGPDPKFPFYLRRSHVQWTDRPAADGATPPGPRWLLLDPGVVWNDRAQEIAVCGPFKPEPFVQKMPDPMSTTVTPAP